MWIFVIFAFFLFVLYQNFKLENHERCEEKVLKKFIKETNYEVFQLEISKSNIINTFKTEYDDSKPNIVLIHGFGGGLAIWSRIIDKLSKNFNIYTFDLLGFGRSSKPTFTGTIPKESLDFWIESFKEWIQLMRLKKFTLVGHSLGGFIAVYYARYHPENIEKLILAAPIGLGGWNWDPNTPFKKIIANIFLGQYGLTPQSLLRFFGYFSYPVWNLIGNVVKFRGFDETSWDYLYHNQVTKQSGDLAFVRLFTEQGWNFPFFDEIKDVKVPVRLIYGEKDYILPSQGPLIVKELTTKSDYFVLKGEKHHFYWNNPEFIDLIIN